LKKADFEKHGIVNFPKEEVLHTGALLGDVQLKLMLALQTFRILVDRRVGLIVNGLTTGDHKAKEHFLGLAVDGFLWPADGPIDMNLIFKAALTAGFKGIGIYWNGLQYSFHLDLRDVYGFWGGYKDKKKGIKDWIYIPILIDLPALTEIGLDRNRP